MGLAILGILVLGSGEKEKIAGNPEGKEPGPVKVGIYEGEMAPDFTLEGLRGEKVGLSEKRGKVVLLNFWATWCPPCRREIPSMVELYKKRKDNGLEMLGVNLDKIDRSGVEKFSREYGIDFPILLDPSGKVAALYGIVALPTTLLLDRKGKIRARVTGGVDWTTQENLQKIETLLAETG